MPKLLCPASTTDPISRHRAPCFLDLGHEGNHVNGLLIWRDPTPEEKASWKRCSTCNRPVETDEFWQRTGNSECREQNSGSCKALTVNWRSRTLEAERQRDSAHEALKNIVAEFKKEAEEADEEIEELVAHRDALEEQINDIADALGDDTEWSNCNDRGVNALRIATGLQHGIKELKEKRSKLLSERDLARNLNTKLEASIQAEKTAFIDAYNQIAKQKEVLEFYADEENHRGDYSNNSNVALDNGLLARTALENKQ